jgi:hypothetical protein
MIRSSCLQVPVLAAALETGAEYLVSNDSSCLMHLQGLLSRKKKKLKKSCLGVSRSRSGFRHNPMRRALPASVPRRSTEIKGRATVCLLFLPTTLAVSRSSGNGRFNSRPTSASLPAPKLRLRQCLCCASNTDGPQLLRTTIP